MGKVKLYEAQNITSRAVGTAGVNPIGDVFENASQNALVATQRMILAENAKIKIADNMEAEKHKIQWENDFYNNIEKQKQDKANLDNPFGLADDTYNSGTDSANEYASTISNPRAKEMFLAKSQETLASAQTGMRKWASEQTTTNAFVNLTDSLQGMYLQAGKVKNAAGFNGLLSQGEALIANAAPVIGTENATKLRYQMRKEVSKNYIYSQIDAAPGTVKAQLNGGLFDKTLDAQDKVSLLHTADAVEKRNIAEQKQASALSNHINVNQMRVAEAENKLTIGQIDNAIANAQKNGARQSDIDKLYSMKVRLIHGDKPHGQGGHGSGSPKLYPKHDDPQSVDHITNDLAYITGFTQKGKVSAKGVKVDKETTLNRLQKSQDLLDANRTHISAKSAEKFQNIIDHGWMVYTDKNKYASNLHKNLPIFGKANVNEFNQGLIALQKNTDTTFKIKSDRQRAKAMAIQYYNKYYNTARKMPGFNNAKFTQDIINRTRRAMENY